MPRPSTGTENGGYSAGFAWGYDIAGPPFPADWRSSVPAIPPSDDPDHSLPPGYAWAGDRCAPQRQDSELYRRAVHLGEITPWGEPATWGVALNAAEVAAAVYFANLATMHGPGSDTAVQVHSASRDYDHGPFSQGFG